MRSAVRRTITPPCSVSSRQAVSVSVGGTHQNNSSINNSSSYVSGQGISSRSSNSSSRFAGLMVSTSSSSSSSSALIASISSRRFGTTRSLRCTTSDNNANGSGDIHAEEISFVDDDASFQAAQDASSSSGQQQQLSFQDVVGPVDTFSRARVLNFIKRYQTKTGSTSKALTPVSPSSSSASGAGQEDSFFEITMQSHTDHATGLEDKVFLARVRLPLPEEYGEQYGIGIASSKKDAELLAAMHAEYIIDAFGFQIYTLSSMQKKHAEAALKAGRWAPQPGEGLRDMSTVTLPMPLRRLVDRDESENGAFHLVDHRPLPFRQHPHTLLSPALVDPGALQRIRSFFASYHKSFDVAQKFTEIQPIDKNDPKQFLAEITLEPLEARPVKVAQGKAPDRNIALILAAMHAEMIIDACGAPLFPVDFQKQQLHARTVRGYGRPVTVGNEPKPKDPILPLPLKLFTPKAGTPRVCGRGVEEDYIHKNVLLAEGVVEFKNVEISEMDSMALTNLQTFLQESGALRVGDPFMLEAVGNQWRATVVLPIDNLYGIRGGVGIAEQPSDAEKLAAMHALDILVALGVPVSSDAAKQEAFLKKRELDGRAMPPPSPAPHATPSPPALRRVTAHGLSRPNPTPAVAAVDTTKNNSNTPSVSASAATAAGGGEDLTDPMPHRLTTDKSFWDLEPDTDDGYILVKTKTPPGVSVTNFGHTLASVRFLDAMARSRIINYLAFMGKRTANTFSYQKLPAGRDGYPVHRCIIKIPVPTELGERLAVGEGPETKDAEVLACMHAELILDNLGIPLYADASQQLRHATAVTSVGRFAPFPGDPVQEKDTPSPPPLRMLREQQFATTSTSTPSAAPTTGPTTTATKSNTSAAKAPAPSTTPEHPSLSSPAAQEKQPEFEYVAEHDMDLNAKARVQNYLRRTVRVMPEPNIQVEVRQASSLHFAKLWVPVPTKFGHKFAVGIADKKKDADLLCYMHAERIIDALGLHLFNLPGLQKRHAARVKRLGRWAPLSGEVVNKPANTPIPPPLRFGNVIVRANHPTPTEMQLQDYTAWSMFVKDCEEFIDVAQQQYENECFDKDLVPMTGDPFIDSTLEASQTLHLDVHAKSVLQNYCFHTNLRYPNLWKSRAVGDVVNRKCLTTVEVPGFEHLSAFGVSGSKENSQRRAAMHAIEIIRRLDPNFHVIQALQPSQGLTTDGRAATDARGNPLSARQVQMRDMHVGSWDNQSNAFTNDGKIRVIELFTVCNALPAPFVSQKTRDEGGISIGFTQVEVQDEEGIKWYGRADDNGPRRNEAGAYNDLFINLSRNIPSFQSLMQLVRTHPHLSPDQIVDLSIPPEISERMEKLVEGFEDDTVTESVAAEISEDVTTATLCQQTDLTANPLEKQVRALDLQRKLAAKEADPNYKEKFQGRRETLSIYDKREEIMNTIIKNRVTVICGTTGCGKTTQLPQYILDHETANGTGGDCTIIVTQPRRISAVSISQRIADERLEKIGDSVGYTIRLDSTPGKHINFVTSGVLLRIFQAKPRLDGIKYVIIDEIHERDINSDFLLILMRELSMVRDDLRIILMSATLQSELFSGFFHGAPVINVEGYVYPVQELYIEDLARVATEKKDGGAVVSFKEFDTSLLQAPEGMNNAQFRARGGAGHAGNNNSPRPRYGFMEAHSEIDYPAIEYAVNHIIKYQDVTHSSILVFLPGWDEIVRAKELLEKDQRFFLLLMHSSVNNEDQLKCFQPAPEGKIKIILSTNIAESGVTIDDIRGVIDVGRVKEKSFIMRRGKTNVGKNDMGTMSQLVTVYASRANCVQRRGRAGRTRPGMCIRLYTREHFEVVADFQTPEMLRQPLDSLCLQILALNLGDPSVFLNKALEPPSSEAVEASMKRLTELGAITNMRKLTPLGLALSKLPVAPRIGKSILLGCIFKCLDSALTVASTVEVEVFNASRDMRESVRINREHVSFNTQSDHLASLNAFNMFTTKCAEGATPPEIASYITENSLFIPSLRVISRYKRQFVDILAASGFMGSYRIPKYNVFVDESPYSEFAHDVGLVKAVIAAGLFPNVAMYRGRKLLRNKFDNVIAPAAASVLARTAHDDVRNPFFVYEEMMRASEGGNRLTIRGLTNVSLWAVMILGAANHQLAYRDDLNLGLIDDWMLFRASFTDLDLLKRFKAFVSKSLVKKLSQPHDFDNNATIDVIRDIIRDLVNSPLRPNNLVEGAWEENGVISAGRPSITDPTLLIVPPTMPGEGEAEENRGDTAQAVHNAPDAATPTTATAPAADEAATKPAGSSTAENAASGDAEISAENSVPDDLAADFHIKK